MDVAKTRGAVVAAVGRSFEAGVMSHSGHAGLSARVGEAMVITSTGSVLGMTAQSLSVVGLDGVVREGAIDATNREIVTMHTAVYRVRPEVGG